GLARAKLDGDGAFVRALARREGDRRRAPRRDGPVAERDPRAVAASELDADAGDIDGRGDGKRGAFTRFDLRLDRDLDVLRQRDVAAEEGEHQWGPREPENDHASCYPVASMNDFQRFRGTDRYLTSTGLESAVNCALALERPLLVRGEPGTGKTM